MMKEIIDPIEKHLLVQELTPDKFLRKANKGGNEIYSFTFHDSPHLMLEVARLREIAFRHSGGGSGAMLDIDAYDTAKVPYRQLIVWDPTAQEIVGGYRYFLGYQKAKDAAKEISLAISTCFKLSEKFTKEYLPHSIELGRAFVHPEYQSSRLGSKSLYILDNLWDGLGALISLHPQVKYFFGKVTTYRSFNPLARNTILRFMRIYFPDHERLLTPNHPLKDDLEAPELRNLFLGVNYDDDFRFLVQKVRQLGENLPPLLSAYVNLSSTMKVLGTTVNEAFGDVDETAILVTISDIYPNKLARHVASYQKATASYELVND